MNSPEKLAQQVDRFLAKREIKLTMGGEPTFVPLVPSAQEWNNAAMGDEKLAYARRMAVRMLEDTYPGGILLQVFGKQFPGEPLPRWNLIILHHPDRSLWSTPQRFHLESAASHQSPARLKKLAHAVAAHLGFSQNLLTAQFPKASKRGSAFVLPLDYDPELKAWISDDWHKTFPKGIALFPGDSPAGLLLPLAELPTDALRRAITIEIEDGQINLFLPPLPWSAFAELTELLDGLTESLQLDRLILTGYTPYERDEAGVVTYGMAADPGVLEINLPPTSDWASYAAIVDATYQSASAVGLYPTKAGLNGALRGSGGGAHMAFGGPTLASNPFLKNPPLIASFLRYWQHHPALSYAFTGQFVGPGCQAPRVDEGPLHGLYELEVACEGLEHITQVDSGYYIDQALRNLLTDSSGNTHRAEICFDKFHNALAPNGLLGIVEFRSFEMVPESADLSVIALLLRTIFARLIKRPFKKQLKRWGPALHDQYFLPTPLIADLQSICTDLQKTGFTFQFEWLDKVLAFRFPVLGELPLPGTGTLQVRQALESFPLMAEESLGMNTIRMVDNSTDRLELSVSAAHSTLADEVLVINGVEVPLHPTPDGKASFAGLRYKCASAYPALHPHVPIQSPLKIRWVDRATRQIKAAATYHYWNPSAAVYDGLPEDREEAATRCKVRWVVEPTLVGTLQPAPKIPKRSKEYSHTIDLRRNNQPA